MIEAAECRTGIISDFAKWTALSALRSGAPIKSRADVYGLLDKVPFAIVLGGQAEMSIAAFDAWHEDATAVMCARESRLSTGWAVKLINVYLKTAAYVGDLGRPVLRAALHPPIDAGLWAGLSARFCDDRELLAQTHCDIRDLSPHHCRLPHRRGQAGVRTDRSGTALAGRTCACVKTYAAPAGRFNEARLARILFDSPAGELWRQATGGHIWDD